MSVILLLIAVFATGRIEATDPCKYKVGLLFIADGSDTICGGDLVNCDGWNRTRQFMHAMAERMNIGPDDSRVALVKFGAVATKAWDFTKNTDKASLLAAIDSVERPTGEFDNILTASVVLTQEFNVFSGDRPSIVRVAFMVSDGMPEYKPWLQGTVSKVVQITGVTFFIAVITGTPGGGDLNMALWMASQPKPPNNQTYYLVDGYASLESDQVDESASKQICLMLEACYVQTPTGLFPVCNFLPSQSGP